MISKNGYLVGMCIDHSFSHIRLHKYYAQFSFVNGKLKLGREVLLIFLLQELFKVFDLDKEI